MPANPPSAGGGPAVQFGGEGRRAELRIGCVPWVNSIPLIDSITTPITYAVASRLANVLAWSQVDVALIPVIEIFRRDYAFVPGYGIVADGRVDTVLLHVRGRPQDVRVCGLDRNSLTSNALLQILMERCWHASPKYVFTEYPGKMAGVDAALSIGDNSFRRSRVPHIDLGEVWKRFTGLPFVFALWAYRRDHPQAARIRRVLRRAAQDGISRRAEIAKRESKRLGLDHATMRRYLLRRVRYVVGPRELKGMRLFRRLCREMELI